MVNLIAVMTLLQNWVFFSEHSVLYFANKKSCKSVSKKETKTVNI